ncbi:hypothetical protein QM565_36545 [Geitlerinema splendidum]|nr:hypothetical protein [Geitlerinema splendidum]
MISAVLLMVSAPILSPSIADLNDWAQKRDVAAVEASASPELKGKFDFLRGQGAFGVGRFGWTAEHLKVPGSSAEYVVFTTPLTTQDRGDQVFVFF